MQFYSIFFLNCTFETKGCCKFVSIKLGITQHLHNRLNSLYPLKLVKYLQEVTVWK